MGSRRTAPYLEIDEDGIVLLCGPADEDGDEDGDSVRLGHVCDGYTSDRCPDHLQDDLDRLYRDYVRELAESGEGCRELRRLYREGSLR